MKCGLLGRKLAHSYSPAIHAMLGDYAYRLYEKEPEELEDFLRNGDWDGINVTMPYKQTVMDYLDELTPMAKALGAVNTILRRNGKLIGTNTDYFGFHSMITQSGLSPAGKKCLVLGSGGASRVVQTVLREYGANTVVISRAGENTYANIARHADAAIIVNATPVGMYPNCGVSPLAIADFPQLRGVADIIYNPARTQILLDAESRGLTAVNGMLMLVAQAKEASEWFTGKTISDDAILRIQKELKNQMENIVLIGMPGCGKSTVGALLAKKLGRDHTDLDSMIEKKAGKPIPTIFAEDGEAFFRALETQCVQEAGKQTGCVISTGGGVVTRNENYAPLHQNGIIIHLTRKLDHLPTEGRPISQKTDMATLWQQRKALYERFADLTIDNNGTPEETLAFIEQELINR